MTNVNNTLGSHQGVLNRAVQGTHTCVSHQELEKSLEQRDNQWNSCFKVRG